MISIDWGTNIIDIPKADLILVQSNPTEIREMNLNWFRLQLKDIEDNGFGITYLKTHDHNTEVSLGGLTYARVVEILDPYSITFEDGQYAVNLVGANSNVGDKVNVNQVSVRSANSAGLISSPEIEYASFNGGVIVDVNSGNSGTIFPTGTEQKKVDNITDALLIAEYRGFNKLYLHSDITLNSGSDFNNFVLEGQSHVSISVGITSGAQVENIHIEDCDISGVLDGNTEITNCIVRDMEYLDGHIHASSLAGTITLGGDKDAFIVNCSKLDFATTPIINMGGSGQELIMPNYAGIIKITNLTGPNKAGIGLNSGIVILDSATIIAGDIIVSGVGRLVDENDVPIKSGTWNGGVTIQNYLTNPETITDAILTAKPGDYADQCNVAATIVHTVYDGQVYIDSINGSTGTDFPTGTIEHPVNNLADAKIIATGHGMRIFNLLNTFVIGATDNINDYIIRAPLNIDAVLVLTPGCTTKNTRFDHLIIMGTFNGKSYIDHSTTLEIHNFSGFVIDSILMDNIEIVDPTVPSLFNLCGGGKVSPPIEINLNNSSLNIGGWKGEMKIVNKDGSSTNIIELVTGQVTIDATCIAGTIILKGVGRLIQDDSGPGCTVITTDLLNENRITNAVWADPDAVSLVSGMFFMENIEGGRWKIENNQMIFYEEDNTTEIMRFNLFDEAGDPANTDIFDRQRV